MENKSNIETHKLYFLAFYGEQYYPLAGAYSLIGVFPTLESAIKSIKTVHGIKEGINVGWDSHWGQVYDVSRDVVAFEIGVFHGCNED